MNKYRWLVIVASVLCLGPANGMPRPGRCVFEATADLLSAENANILFALWALDEDVPGKLAHLHELHGRDRVDQAALAFVPIRRSIETMCKGLPDGYFD